MDLAPLADGGEGTLEVLRGALALRIRSARVPGPLGDRVRARMGVGRNVVVLEAAEVVGLARIPRVRRDPWRSSTEGLGILLRHALDLGVPRVLVALGGSATVDGGAGLLHALGARFFDERGRLLAPTPLALTRLARVDRSGLDPRLSKVELVALCDVRVPLLGERGARMFMEQKGVRRADLERAEDVLARLHPSRVARRAGAGAAGGLGAALASLGARLVSGGERVLAEHGIRRRVGRAELVITGEGRLDEQTLQGKAIAALARECRRAGTPLLALCGRVDLTSAAQRRAGLIALPIVPGPCTIEEAVEGAAANLERAAAAALELVRVRRR